MQTDFLNRFQDYLIKKNLISDEERIVVAVSGGMDSMVLLSCFDQMASKYNLSLLVAHLNHKLRGEESDHDEKFVSEYVQNLNIKFVSKQINVDNYAKENKLSVELAAREVRYQFLEEIRAEKKFDKITTGHHANDQAETVLFNFVRGSGWGGLAGILPKRKNIVRPLLFAYRWEIKKFAEDQNLQYVQDSSNLSMDHTRNYIRHNLLPVIKKELNSNIHKRLNDFSAIFLEGDNYLKVEAKKAYQACLISEEDENFTLDIERFCSYFSILQKYVLFHILAKVKFKQNVLSFRQLGQVLEIIHRGKSGRWYELPSGWKIGIDHSGIVLYKDHQLKPIHRSVTIGEKISLDSLRLKFSSQFSQESLTAFENDCNVEFIDAKKLKNNEIEIRSIESGDYFFPLGLGHKQKLSNFFINHKVPYHKRRKILVLTNGSEIVWVCGCRLDHRYRITENTSNVIKLKIEYE